MTGSRRQAGFTLIELMVVVAIAGIMAAIGIPSIKGVMPRIRLNSNTMTFANEIALARMHAISKSNDFCVVFYSSTSGAVAMRNSFVLKKSNGSCGANTGIQIGANKLTGTDLIRAGIFVPNLVDPFYDPPDPLIAFPEPNTLAAQASGRLDIPLDRRALIELRTPGSGVNRKRIIIEPTGRVYVQRWGGARWQED